MKFEKNEFKIFYLDLTSLSLYTCIHHTDFDLTCSMLLHNLVKVKNVIDFDSILNKPLTCS